MSGFTEERLAPVNGIEIAYQEIGDQEGEPLLLIMGLAMQMLGWDEEFCATLAARGFRVIRFDNRDIGRSTMMDPAGVPKRSDVFLGRRDSAAYLLSDMAADTAGLIDHLGIESAHLVGVSMGGMIGQMLAIERPDRVRSLVSMMSTTGSRRVGTPSYGAFRAMLAPHPHNREDFLERAVRTFGVIGSPAFPMARERIREVASAMYDRSHNPRGVIRQVHAVTASGNRTAELRRLRLPVTVIHGTSDPLIRPSGGRATARAVPGARLRLIEGMGHDLPRELWPIFTEEIAANAARAERPAPAKQVA